MLLLLLCSSISFRHTTHRRFCLGSLSTISLYHAKYVILTLMLATDSLWSSLFALCRSDSCWVMEFKVLVYSSLNWPNSTWILLKQSYWESRYETANKGWTLFTDVPLVRYLIDIHEKSTIKLHNTTNSIVQLLYTGACHTQCSFHFREILFICNWFFLHKLFKQFEFLATYSIHVWRPGMEICGTLMAINPIPTCKKTYVKDLPRAESALV